MASSRAAYPWPLASQYFLRFGIMGVFLPYFNLYCLEIGLTGVEIGALSSVRSLSVIIFPVMFSALADRFNRRKEIYIGCCFASAAAWSLYLGTTAFGWMLLISAVFGVFYSPTISFLEALTMDSLENEQRRYGTVRAWGSASFISAVVVMGKVIDLTTIRIILMTILAGLVTQAFGALKIPFSVKKTKTDSAPGFRVFFRAPILVFLLSAFLMLVSHGAYYGFFSIHLANLGYSGTFIGAVWALASAAEILAMLKSRAIFSRFSLEFVLVFAFAVAVLRWCLLYFFSSPVVLISSQLLHAVTYGMFHMAGILYMDKVSPDGTKTMGQAVNNAVTYGLGLMIGFSINGYLYELAGSQVLFIVSAGIAAAAGIQFWVYTGLLKAASARR